MSETARIIESLSIVRESFDELEHRVGSLFERVDALTAQRDAAVAALRLWVEDYESSPQPDFGGYHTSVAAIAMTEDAKE